MVRIGLSTNLDQTGERDCMPRDYVLAVLRAGGLPLILPMIPMDHPDYDALMDQTIASVDGIVFTGGPDLDPALYYGEARLPQCGVPVPERDRADIALIRRALDVNKPFLGICRGIQVANVALGGSLYQDLNSQLVLSVSHEQPRVSDVHQVKVEDGTLLKSLVRADTLKVNSRHHQAIKTLAPGLRASAYSEDGIIEAVEFSDGRPALCVQWHPENLAASSAQHQALFDWLIAMAKRLS